MLNIPGFVSAERFVCVSEGAHQFLTILEVETDDLQATMAEVEKRSGTDLMPISDALDFETVDVTLWTAYASTG